MLNIPKNLIKESTFFCNESQLIFNPVQSSSVPVNLKIYAAVWKIVESTLFRFSPARIRNFRNLLLRIFGSNLHKSASIHPTVKIDFPFNLVMGKNSSLGRGCQIYAFNTVKIGDYVCISQNSILLTGSHDIGDVAFKLITKPIIIGDGSWVSYGAIILPGTNIGRFSVLAAGSVVTSDIPEGYIAGGNPCKLIKLREFKYQV